MTLEPFYIPNVKLYNVDCTEFTKTLPDNSVDLALFDPPYGVTQHKEDIPVDLTDIFRVSKGVVMTAQQPYTSEVICQFKKYFRYDLVWDKVLTTGHLNCNRLPLRRHESILVFKKVPYTPQKTLGISPSHSKGKMSKNTNNNYGYFDAIDTTQTHGKEKFPTSIVTIPKPHPSKSKHRTEKPIELVLYLLKTYSKPNFTIFDPFSGSGNTAIACMMLPNRYFIGCEKNPNIFSESIRFIKEKLP